MSTKGVYTALSGAMAQAQRLDTIANNMANVNTPGFKKDQQVFREYLTANEKPPSVIQVPRIPASIESFYDMQGGDKSYVDSAGTYTDHSQGSLKHTGNALDLAVDGSGFFEIATPGGVRLTRHGSFSIDGNGQVVNKDGFPLLAAAAPGTDPAERVIRVQGGKLTITDNGEIFDEENALGKVGLVTVANKDDLKKIGSSLYQFAPDSQSQAEVVENPKLKQGFLEMSNVNIVQEMTDMIGTTRVFESTQKAISSYDQMNDKLVNVVPKTNG